MWRCEDVKKQTCEDCEDVRCADVRCEAVLSQHISAPFFKKNPALRRSREKQGFRSISHQPILKLVGVKTAGCQNENPNVLRMYV